MYLQSLPSLTKKIRFGFLLMGCCFVYGRGKINHSNNKDIGNKTSNSIIFVINGVIVSGEENFYDSTIYLVKKEKKKPTLRFTAKKKTENPNPEKHSEKISPAKNKSQVQITKKDTGTHFRPGNSRESCMVIVVKNHLVKGTVSYKSISNSAILQKAILWFYGVKIIKTLKNNTFSIRPPPFLC